MTTASAAGFSSFIQRLDLADNPFTEQQRLQYFYPGAKRQETLDQLVHFCRYSQQLVVLTGAAGSGRSVLLDGLQQAIGDVVDCCHCSQAATLNPQSLLGLLVDKLRLPASAAISSEGFLQHLQHVNQADEALPLLLIIEQAESLEPRCMALVVQLAQQSRGQIHLLLSGEARLVASLSEAGVQAGEIKRLNLPSLNPEQAGEYVLGRLQSVGYAGEQPLSQDQLAVLVEQSHGLPAAINRLAVDMLNQPPVQAPPANRWQIPRLHVLVIVVLSAILLLALWQGGSDSRSAPQPLALPLPPAQEDSDSGVVERQLALADTADEAVDYRVAGDENRQSQGVASNISGSSIPRTATTPATTPEQPDQPAAANAAPEPPAPAPAAEPQTPASPIAPNQPAPAAKPTAPKQTVPAARPAVPKQPAPANSPSAPKQAASAAKPAATPQPEPAAAVVADWSPREQRLLAIPAEQWMLQLFATRDEAKARKLITDHISGWPLSYFQRQLQGNTVYVVVAGPYTNREQAAAAAQTLPAVLRQPKPWLRQAAAIQRDMKKSR